MLSMTKLYEKNWKYKNSYPRYQQPALCCVIYNICSYWWKIPMKVNNGFQEIHFHEVFFCLFFSFKCIAKSNILDVEKQLFSILSIKQ